MPELLDRVEQSDAVGRERQRVSAWCFHALGAIDVSREILRLSCILRLTSLRAVATCDDEGGDPDQAEHGAELEVLAPERVPAAT